MQDKKRISHLFHKLWFNIAVCAGLAGCAVLMVILSSVDFSFESEPKVLSEEDFMDHLATFIPSAMNAYEIPGVIVAVIDEGKTVWTGAFGYADLQEKRKMTVDTVCRVESISKSVTAWGVMRLVEQGKIELDEPVTSYIKNWDFPESKFSEEDITTRHLLSATSGMPLGDFEARYPPISDTIPTLKESLSEHAVLMQEPGSSFYYSNVGFHVLELLIEEVTGWDFAEYMKEKVMTPLGMENSSFAWSGTFDPPVPNGHWIDGTSIAPYTYPEKASGGLFATVEDIARFVIAGMTDFSKTGVAVLTTESIQALYTPHVQPTGYYKWVFDAYGYGHFIETLQTGEKAVSHGGQGAGWMTHFHSVPETGDGIVLLTNSSRSWPFLSFLLNDWAQWHGFSSVGFSLIGKVQKALWGVIGLLLFLLLWQVWRVVRDLLLRVRRFAPLWKEYRALRIVQSVLAVLFGGTFVWIVCLDYFFLTSVFPIASGWLYWTLLFAALVSFFSSTTSDSIS